MNRLVILLVALVFATNFAQAQEVQFSPGDNAPTTTQQIKVAFPQAMMNVNDAFTVQCQPEVAGDGYWADNNTTWVYNFNLPKNEYGEPLALMGGTTCSVSQNVALKSVTDKIFAMGTLNHKFSVEGPFLQNAFVLPGIGYNKLRETQPVLMLVYSGDIERDSVYNGGTYLYYKDQSAAPASAISVQPVPQAQADALFEVFQNEYSYRMESLDVTKDSRRWVLVTVNQDLIPGAPMELASTGIVSAYNSSLRPQGRRIENLSVRDNFKVTVSCSRAEEFGPCLPESSPYVNFNSKVPWEIAKNIKVEFVPRGSKDGQSVFASPKAENVASNWLGYWFSEIKLALVGTDALVDSVDFSHVKVAPNTQAKVIFPSPMKDVDGRVWNQPLYVLEYGSFQESIRMASGFRIMERLVPGNDNFPIVIMNLNQTVTTKVSGQGSWQPITDVATILNMMEADQANQQTWQEDYAYQSPMEAAGVKSTLTSQKLSGSTNQLQLISYPYAMGPQGVQSGVYAMELSTDLMGDQQPTFAMTNVTDLAVHVKKGQDQSLVWVTSMSSGDVVANAAVEVYSCEKAKVASGMTNQDGLYSFDNSQLPSCQVNDWYSEQKFYVSVKTTTDMALISSEQTVYSVSAMSAPGVEYYYPTIQEGVVNYQTVIGVNLVKPGQTVPVKIIANVPSAEGFRAAKPSELPESVNVVYSQNSKISYKFNLNWNNGAAEFKWSVPKSAELGSYYIQVAQTGDESPLSIGSSDIEVSEFKIPLMSAALDLPKAPLLKPASLEVAGMVQYANGVGAKDLAIDFSYYFAPSQLENNEGFESYSFARGKFDPNGEAKVQGNGGLPSEKSVAQIAELSTGQDGTVKVDIAGQMAANNESVATLLANATRPYSMIVRMKYQDQMGEFQTLSASRTIYNASSYVGTTVESGKMEDAALKVVVLGLDGKPYTNLADLEMNVVEKKANIVGEELFGGFIKNNISFETVATNWKAQCVSNQDGSASCQVSGLDYGSYIFEVASKTSGQVTYSAFTVDREGQVTGEQGGYWEEATPKSLLAMTADKETYKGGEVAKLNFESPFATCAALVTLERADVYESFVDMKACENGYVSMPVDSALAPNVFASVYLVKEREGVVTQDQMDLGKPTYKIGYSNLKIDWSNYAADVVVAMDKKEYKPGEMAQVSIQVSPQEGQLMNPEATLIVVEEKILEMKQNKTMEILAAMMGLRGHTVELINGYEGIESAAAKAGAVVEAAAMDEAKAGEEGGDGSDMETFKRKLFDALVTWKTVPVINGEAQTSFKLNDSLTKFKVFAVVQDSANKFGMGSVDYLSAQEVQSYPNMPPVARTGDKFPVTVTLQNNGAAAGEFTVVVDYKMLDANGSVVSSGQISSSQNIDAASSKPVKAGDLEVKEGVSQITYEVVVKDANGVVVDQLTPDAQSIKPAIPLSVQEEFMVQIDQGSVPFTFAKDAKALAGQGMIDAAVFSSLVDSTREKVKKSIADNPWADITIENRVIAALVAGQGMQDVYAELVNYVDEQGFIKYYAKADKGSFWMTAEVLKLIGAYGAANDLPANLKASFVSAMQMALDGQLGQDYLEQSEAVAIYAKVKALNALGAVDKAAAEPYVAAVVDDVEKLALETLPVSALTEMTQAIATYAPGLTAQSYIFQYIKGGKLVLNNASAKLDDVAAFGWWGYSDETIGTAKLVQALSLDARATGAKSSENYLDNLVTGMVNANQTGGWYNMRTQAWVLASLMEFSKTYESVPVSGQTQIKNSESVAVDTVVWGQNNQKAGSSVEWKSDSATVTFDHKGAGKPWASVTASAAVKLEAPNYKGIQVEKVISNVTRQDGTFQAGDLINVTIKLTVNGDARHVVLFDPIPGGANILTEGWGAFSSSQKSYAGYKAYFNYLSGGTSEVTYQYQLNNPGTFNISPTRAEALYEPGYFGEIPNATMEVAQ